MDFSSRIKALRLQFPLTQKELADSIGVSIMTIRNWESGEKSPSTQAIISLSKLFEVSADELLGLRPTNLSCYPMTKEESKLLRNYRTLDKYGRNVVETVCVLERERIESSEQEETTISTIPMFVTPSAAGYSAPIDGDDFVMISPHNDSPAGADFAVRIQGNSMEPFIKDGETVFVRRQTELNNGDVCIFSINGSLYCKLYYVDKDRNLTLVSANPDMRDSNVFISADSGATVVCYGRVLTKTPVPFPEYFDR